MRGLSWGRKHSTVDYVWRYSPYRLYLYHCRVIAEMTKRGYKHDELWDDALYRGKNAPITRPPHELKCKVLGLVGEIIYPEHDDAYLRECLDNLKSKGVVLNENDFMNEEV